MDKKTARLRRAKKARSHIRRLGVGRHIYAQVIAAAGRNVIAAASTVQKDLRSGLTSTSNKDAAKAVGKAVAEKAVAAGVTEVAFDRSGYRYHGRIAQLADAARESGLKF